MAAGDVTSTIIAKPHTTTTINAAVAALRNTANDHWLAAELDGQLVVINIEEA